MRGPGAALERYERLPPRPASTRLGTDPGERCRACTPTCWRSTSPVREGVRYDVDARCSAATTTSRRLRALVDQLARGLDHRARRARQDPPRPRRSARDADAAGRALRRAGRRHVRRGRRRRGRLRARGARLGQRAPGRSRPSSAPTSAPGSRSSSPRAGACWCSTTASTSSRPSPTLVAFLSRDHPRPAGAHHEPRAARRSPPSASTCSASSRRPTRVALFCQRAHGRAPRRATCPRTSCGASWPGSTACRWRSSWPPRRCARCRSRRSPPARGPVRPAARRRPHARPTGTRPCSR